MLKNNDMKGCWKTTMNILFVYYVPSGGVETLNRQRSAALKQAGINSHFLYFRKARDLVNDHEGPTFITDDDTEIKAILDKGNYQWMVIISDYKSIPRFRNFGYTGPIILEIQGYGPKHVARTEMTNAVPYVTTPKVGLLNPKTPHISQIFSELFPSIPTYQFNNCFDSKKFAYKRLPKSEKPIVAWIGRLEDNKNWREFLQIGKQLLNDVNNGIQLYMFEDPTLSTQEERAAFQLLVEQLQLAEHLTVLPNIPNEQMADYYSMIGDSGGFLCSTSKVEGAPYSVLEAFSCKCPVLTTDSDGVRSSIIHNVTGKYYPLGDIEAACKEAKELMFSVPLREHIRTSAYLHLRREFSPEQYCQNFVSMMSHFGVKPQN
ncbi:glycosyltransferase family 4 protein [Niallia sp. FSL R7-0271]|uniref:glycosyltransferase family 4 protein n=1 Tax=Niallia sp. FSL R7-0271 TaxID=2921678 RepID=UPI0030F857D2